MAFDLTYKPPTGYDTVDGTNLAWTESHAEEAKQLLLSRFRGKPRIEAAITALLAGTQEWTNAIWQMMVGLWVDTAVGAQLDLLGSLVNQSRLALDDDAYRGLIRARILANKSDSTATDLWGVIRAALGSPTGAIASIKDYPPAEFEARLKQVPGFDAGLIAMLLRDARGAAIRGVTVAPVDHDGRILDENGDPILDENGDPIVDSRYGLTGHLTTGRAVDYPQYDTGKGLSSALDSSVVGGGFARAMES